MTNVMNRWIIEAFRKLRVQYGAKCFLCGSEYNLVFHHIKVTEVNGKGRGRKERYYDIIKNPECYEMICENCHKMVHSKTNTKLDKVLSVP